jgi:hypothetical protein
MNVFRARRVLLAVQRDETRHLRVRRPENNSDVCEMVQEGLLDANLSDGSEGSATVLGTLTDAGRRFLQTFPVKYRFCDAR